MTKDAEFWVALLLIAGALFALRLCHPHAGEFKQKRVGVADFDRS
jgi:hypothetical protein